MCYQIDMGKNYMFLCFVWRKINLDIYAVHVVVEFVMGTVSIKRKIVV